MEMTPHGHPRRHVNQLRKAADLLDSARDTEQLATAVRNNLDVWTTLKSVAETPRSFPEAERRRINKLADYVISVTRGTGRIAPGDQDIEHFISMNKVLAKDLTERQTR